MTLLSWQVGMGYLLNFDLVFNDGCMFSPFLLLYIYIYLFSFIWYVFTLLGLFKIRSTLYPATYKFKYNQLRSESVSSKLTVCHPAFFGHITLWYDLNLVVQIMG